MARPIGTQPSMEALRLMYEQSRDDMQAMVRSIEAHDTKSSKLLRMNILVMGILVTVLRFEPASDGLSPQGEVWALRLFTSGFFLVALSTVLAGVSFVGKGTVVGISSISASLDLPVTERAWRRTAILRYERGKEENDEVSRRALRWFQGSVGALLLGILSLSCSTGILLLDATP